MFFKDTSLKLELFEKFRDAKLEKLEFQRHSFKSYESDTQQCWSANVILQFNSVSKKD